jgi:hypothetical protein
VSNYSLYGMLQYMAILPRVVNAVSYDATLSICLQS